MDLTKNFDRDCFESMSIHDLRVIGRNAGVEAPTRKSKGDLIEAILEKVAANGGRLVQNEPVKQTKGRPPKRHIELTLNDSGIAVDLAEPKKEEAKALEATPAETATNTEANKTPTEIEEDRFKRKRPIQNGNEYYKRQNNNFSGNINGAPYNNSNNRYANNGYNNGYGNNGYNNNYNQNGGSGYGNGYNANGNGGYASNGYNNNGYNNGYNNGGSYQPRPRRDLNAEVNDEAPVNNDSGEAVLVVKEGILEIMADGYGFLRAHNYEESGTDDAYVSAQKIKRSGLRKGDWVKAEASQTREGKPAGVVNILEVNGQPPESAYKRVNFDSLTPIYPNKRYRLELPIGIANKSNDLAIRAIDMVAPIGKGQRAMIVSPPKAGKTSLLKMIAKSIAINYPEASLIVLLIDERPEEVTDMKNSIKGEVVYSTFDEMPEHHTKAAELVLERAKRLVELGKDVVILMDSLTRLARAYNLTISPTGRTLSGGIDPGALHSPKRFFGAARNIENGGSLTIIATALVDTGSRMDDVIYEEFKGTGNMEIHLDRRLSEKRIFPAIDMYRSGTRREELLLDGEELQGVWGMRRMLSMGEGVDATENLINMLIKTNTNKEFIDQLTVKLKNMQSQGFITTGVGPNTAL